MRKLYEITKRDFINLMINPMWVFYATLFPLLLTFILGYLTSDNYGTIVTSYDYYGITLLLYSLLNSGMTSANAFLEERIKKPNMRIIYAPGSISYLYLSKIIASFLFSFIFHMLDLLVLYLLFHLRLGNIVLLVGIFAATELFAVTLGIMLCCLIKTESITNQIQMVIVNIIAIFGGLLFSMDGYGALIRKISLFSPAKWLVNTTFAMIYDNNLSSYLPTILFLLFSTLVMILICKLSFKKEDCLC